MADDTPNLQNAADLAEKYGDTKTQDNVKKMQYPYATDEKGSNDPSLYPSEARQQRYRTQWRDASYRDAYNLRKKEGK